MDNPLLFLIFHQNWMTVNGSKWGQTKAGASSEIQNSNTFAQFWMEIMIFSKFW